MDCWKIRKSRFPYSSNSLTLCRSKSFFYVSGLSRARLHLNQSRWSSTKPRRESTFSRSSLMRVGKKFSSKISRKLHGDKITFLPSWAEEMRQLPAFMCEAVGSFSRFQLLKAEPRDSPSQQSASTVVKIDMNIFTSFCCSALFEREFMASRRVYHDRSVSIKKAVWGFMRFFIFMTREGLEGLHHHCKPHLNSSFLHWMLSTLKANLFSSTSDCSPLPQATQRVEASFQGFARCRLFFCWSSCFWCSGNQFTFSLDFTVENHEFYYIFFHLTLTLLTCSPHSPLFNFLQINNSDITWPESPRIEWRYNV